MKPNEYRQFLKDNLKPWAKDAGGYREVVTRCPYCPDSKDPNKGHFYISIPGEDELSFYDCKKCPAHGVVTPEKLIEWGITDINLLTELSSYNKRVSSLSKNKLYKDNIIFNINYNYITDDKLSRYKLSYINNRIGANLTFEDCKRLKIIINLLDLFKVNNLRPTRHENIINQLDHNFIGFLSFDNAFVNLRNLEITKDIYEGINKRYINYNLFNKFDNSQRFYTIPTQIDLFKPVTIHIAEGSFDILSIYLNLPQNRSGNDIYTSIGGNGYKGIMRFFITQLKLPNVIAHIYPDNDINERVMIDTANYLAPLNIPVFVHRNNYKGEKDFGVPSDRIHEIIEQLC